MITWLVFFLTIGATMGVVGLPLWQEAKRPWLLNTPKGDEEALRQEQVAALDALRDLVMDVKLGNLDQADYQALAAPLQQRAKRTLELQAQLRQADRTTKAGAGARGKQTKQTGRAGRGGADLDALLESEIAAVRQTNGKRPIEQMPAGAAHFCPQCGQPVSTEFRFCAGCGAKLPSNAVASLASVIPDEVKVAPVVVQPQNAPRQVESGFTHTASVGTAHVPAAPQPDLTLPNRKVSPWLWRAGLVVAALWIVAVVWFYLSSRADMANQIPVATFSDVSIRSLSVGGDLVVMGESKGIQTSMDGQKWNPLPVAGDIRGVARLDNTGRAWLAASPSGLWRSTDGANSWQPVKTTPADLALITIASVPSQVGLVWGATSGALYVSQNGGERWTQIESMLPGTPRVLVAGSMDLFLGTNRGVFRSTDGGHTWGNFSGSANGGLPSLNIQTLAFDEANGLLYAGTPAGLSFQKLDAPGSWGQRSLNGDVTALALGGANNEELWAGTAAGLLLRSRDRGVTW